MIPLEKAVSEYLAQNAKQCDYNPTCKQASPPISVFLDFNSDNSFFVVGWGGNRAWNDGKETATCFWRKGVAGLITSWYRYCARNTTSLSEPLSHGTSQFGSLLRGLIDAGLLADRSSLQKARAS